MAIRIHHNTAKKAKKFGIELRVVENEVECWKDGVMLSTAPAGNVALDRAVEKLNGEAKPGLLGRIFGRKSKTVATDEISDDDGEDEAEVEDEPESDEGASVVKRKYKTRYRPFKMTCGDDLAKLISDHVSSEGDDGEVRIDRVKLRRFALVNGVWDPKYAHLNIGMQRMNVANRLRAKVRKGHEIVWG
jgi:hypothetical protein